MAATDDPEAKALLLDLADQLRELADQIEAYHRDRQRLN